MKVYVATSWRNEVQDIIVTTLKGLRYEVYDFRNPAPGNKGFGWRQVAASPPPWSVGTYLEVIKHPLADEGFKLDMDALIACDACVLVLPCGKSAHLELGWACGAGKKTLVLMPTQYETHEPELMYKMCDAIVGSVHGMVSHLAIWRSAMERSF